MNEITYLVAVLFFACGVGVGIIAGLLYSVSVDNSVRKMTDDEVSSWLIKK